MTNTLLSSSLETSVNKKTVRTTTLTTTTTTATATTTSVLYARLRVKNEIEKIANQIKVFFNKLFG